MISPADNNQPQSFMARHWTIIDGKKVEFPPVKFHLVKNRKAPRKDKRRKPQ